MAFLSILKLLALVVITIIIVPIQIIFSLFNNTSIMPKYWHRGVCFIYNIKVRSIGKPRTHQNTPTLFLVNHLSYLDIVVLGATLDATFVAKSEVASWPVFGFLAKLQNTIFIERKASGLAAAQNAITKAINAGKNVILFAEGTSSDGTKVLPFKASLLGIMPSKNSTTKVQVQPVAITLNADYPRDRYTWWRLEDELAPHLWIFGKIWRTDITVSYLDPLDPSDFNDRKLLAAAAQKIVADVVENKNAPVAHQDRATVS